jgi:two-component system, NtrC family, sensor histidine kinase HydH
VPASFPPRWLRAIRAQDLVWLLLFAVLAGTSPGIDSSEFSLLLALLVWQVAEPKAAALASMQGRLLSIALKLVLGYLLIGYTGGLNSRYFLVLLLPVVTAATTFGVFVSFLIALAAGGSYLSFLLYVDWIHYVLGPTEIAELVVRVAFLAMAGNLVNTLAEDLRRQSEHNRRTAEQLAEANRHLQEAEEAVRRSDRLAALGQLTAGLAHELRNPLGTIKASAEVLGKNLPDNDLAREMAGYIASEVDRTNSLVTRFLQFARPLQVKVETADLISVLDRAADAVAREAPQVALYRNYSPDIPPFPLDAELMERVFFNLLLNAAQASPEGGAVTIKTRAAGGTAEVAVIDRGSGIDPAQMDSVFNPFFTTKPDGVGLGLAIVAKIVDEHGGKIAVESEPGKGSVFRVQLPMERPAPTTSA